MDDFEIDSAYGLPGFASAAGISTIGHRKRGREGRCTARDDTCKGFRVRNSDLCYGHKRAAAADALRAAAALEAVTE